MMKNDTKKTERRSQTLSNVKCEYFGWINKRVTNESNLTVATATATATSVVAVVVAIITVAAL